GVLEPPFEVAAGHVLRDEVELPVLLADIVDGDDVRVVPEAPHRLDLALDPAAPRLVQLLGLDERDGDLPVEARVAGEVDALLAAPPEEPPHTVAPAREGARQPIGRARRRGGCRTRGPAQSLPAGVAEGLPGRGARAAVGTGQRRGQRAATGAAELRALAIRM